MRLAALVVLVLLAMAAAPSYIGRAQTVSTINIGIDYDTVLDIAVVEYNVTLSEWVGEGGVVLDIQLITGDTVAILNVTGDLGQAFPFNYDSATGVLTIYANETKTVRILYQVTGFMEEVAPGTFTGFIDLTPYTGASVCLILTITSPYDAHIEPATGATVEKTADKTVVTLTQTLAYTIYLLTEETVEATATTTTTTTTTTGGAAATATTTTTTGAAAGTQATTTTTGTATAPATQPPTPAWVIPVVAVVAVAAALALAYMYLKRR